MDDHKVAGIFKALGDEHRIQILKLLRSGEKCAHCLLEQMNISQPTLSHHMKILCDSGIVIAHKDGKWIYYSICCDSAAHIRALLQDILSPANMPANCCCDQN